MDLSFTPQEKAFQAEVRTFLDSEIPRDFWFWQGTEDMEAFEFARQMERKLAQRGWFLMDLPEKYGGGKHGPIEQGIFGEEFGYHRCGYANHIGAISARMMVMFSSEEQQDRWVPEIARGGEIIYCEGYTEPDAGSDLASLKTTAVRQGDEWVINGQKAFNTHAHLADYVWTLARTNPDVRRQEGLSMFNVDMKTPGVTVRRQKLLGPTLANDVFFDDVRVPAANLVGEEGQGWNYFGSYKGGTDNLWWASLNRRLFDNLVDFCRESTFDGAPLAKDPLVRHRLADLRVHVECWRLLAWRDYWMVTQELPITAKGGLCGLFRGEFPPMLRRAGRDIVQKYSVVKKGSKWAKLAGEIEELATEQWRNMHPGGTLDVRRNVIARRALDLPRG